MSPSAPTCDRDRLLYGSQRSEYTKKKIIPHLPALGGEILLNLAGEVARHPGPST